MASRGRGARVKGAQFERDIAAFLSNKTGILFQRGLAQTRGGGKEVADVTCDKLPIPFHFELKRQKKCNIRAAWAQCSNDAPEAAYKVVITKDDREETFVTMKLEEWVHLFRIFLENV